MKTEKKKRPVPVHKKNPVRTAKNRAMAPRPGDMEPADRLLLDPKLALRIRERSRKQLITLRLPVWQVAAARKIAVRQKLPYQKVIQAWVGEGLRHGVRTRQSGRATMN